MDENNSVGLTGMATGIFHHTLNPPYISEMGLLLSGFYKAFASLDRAEGCCRLTLFWKKGKRGRRGLEAHTYLLRYNHEGVKEYRVEDFSTPGIKGWRNRIAYETVRLSFSEAAALIQDAYSQNIRFQSKPAAGFKEDHFLLEYDTEGVARQELISKLMPSDLQPEQFAHIILAGMRRLDKTLLYDSASQELQQELGSRKAYISDGEEESSHFTFLQTSVAALESAGPVYRAKAYAVVSTPADEIIRIVYELKFLRQLAGYSLLGLTEVDRERLGADHPANPLNYCVFSTLYHHSNADLIRRWLREQPGIILSGELPNSEVYKWLNGGSEPWEEFNLTLSVSAEFLLNAKELLIYAQNPLNLASIERLIAEDLAPFLEYSGKYYLPVSDLYPVIIEELSANDTWPGIGQIFRDKRAETEILQISPLEKKQLMQEMENQSGKGLRLGLDTYYYPIRAGDLRGDVYLCGRWIKLNMFTGDWGREEISNLRSRFSIINLIQDFELENRLDLFTLPISEQRMWQIFRTLAILTREAEVFREMGLVPNVKEMAKRMGVVRAGAS